MMPILHSPAVMIPGQFGPIRTLLGLSFRYALTATMSRTGMPSVMATISLDAGVGGFHDRVGGERRRHENHRRVGAGGVNRLRERCQRSAGHWRLLSRLCRA